MPFAKSLRTKVLLSTLVPLALVLVVVGVIALRAYESEAGKVVLRRDTELAQVSAARLFEELARNRRILQTLADDQDTQSLEPSRMRRALERTQTQLFVFNAGVVIYDGDGVAIWSDPFSFERRGTRFPAPREFDKASATLAPSLSNVFRDEVSGEDVIMLTVPIVARGPELKGAVTGMTTLDSLSLNTKYSEVLEITEGSGHFAYLIDGNGRVIFHRDRSWLGIDLSTVVPVAQATKGETGALIADGPEGEPVISGFAPVPGTAWAVITQERWSDVIGPIRGFSRLLLGLLVAGGVLSTVLVLFTIGRILKPMRDLTVGARRIAGGDFDQPIVTNTGDEVQALADQFNTMAAALKRSYEGLEQRVVERTEELFAQTREMAVLDERNRMAREIHDTLAQGFTGIVLQLEACEQVLGGGQEAVSAHIGRAKRLARESLQEARRSVWDLVPGVLEARSLEEALAEEVRRFAAGGREKAVFASTGEAKELPRDVQAALLRICQEALMNTRKHARAKQVQVKLDFGPEAVSLVVQDDGVGFDPNAAASAAGQESGFGMTSMAQRASLQGGSLTVDSGNGKGTLIEVRIPVPGTASPTGQ